MSKKQQIVNHTPSSPDDGKVLVRRNVTLRGPITLVGKATSRMNAVKHGLESESMVLEHLGETPARWRRHLRGVLETYQPVGYVECELAGRIAMTLWRLRRVDRYRHEKTLRGYENAEDLAMDALAAGNNHAHPDYFRRAASLPDSRSMYKADAHEQHLTKMLITLSNELRRLQVQRGGFAVLGVDIAEIRNSRNEPTPILPERQPQTGCAGDDSPKPPHSPIRVRAPR